VERTILIIGDDRTVYEALAEQLESERKFTAIVVRTQQEADRLLNDADTRIDAVIFDISVPDGDGRDFCLKMRRKGHKIPIILSGPANEWEVIRGLDAGANDYIVKPFRYNELLARIRAQLRSFDRSEHAFLTVGQYIFRPAEKFLHDPSKKYRILLTNKETQVLKFLHRLEGRPADRKTLLDEVWGYNATIATHTLESHIYRLRQKIEINPSHPEYLIKDQRGYRLEAKPRTLQP
jgi:DNA-binding response OmpR family regulator